MERSRELGTPLASTFYVHLSDTPSDHAVVSKARAACAVTVLSEGQTSIRDQEPKRTHKAKNRTNSNKEFSEQFEEVQRVSNAALANAALVL